MALSALLRDTSGIFRTAVSVAPVTDWRLYGIFQDKWVSYLSFHIDSVYTERYMRIPSKNWKGYNDTSVLNNSANLQRNHGDTNFLLIHGTGLFIICLSLFSTKKDKWFVRRRQRPLWEHGRVELAPHLTRRSVFNHVLWQQRSFHSRR